ncbi:MAG: hypothetical protein FJ405_12560 [Verrucomicrobia bacterium]|nr:hypothetical protein [Verrucomicrobiota bacterium]
MTDEFEDLYGLNKLDPSDASLDGDNDGHDNLEEFRAGTDPGNPASVLKVTSASVIADGSTIQITFESGAGRTYSVWQRMKLGSTTWEKVRTIDAPQDGGTVTVVIPTPGQEAYYQVRLE